ncbi:MAG: hypothetical protein Q7J07_03370, partial [Pelolinea sp.]|nr:hypothetical protein [Pelolinea sp.]
LASSHLISNKENGLYNSPPDSCKPSPSFYLIKVANIWGVNTDKHPYLAVKKEAGMPENRQTDEQRIV